MTSKATLAAEKQQRLVAIRRAMARNAAVNKLYNSPAARRETTYTVGNDHHNVAVAADIAAVNGVPPDPYAFGLMMMRKKEMENAK